MKLLAGVALAHHRHPAAVKDPTNTLPAPVPRQTQAKIPTRHAIRRLFQQATACPHTPHPFVLAILAILAALALATTAWADLAHTFSSPRDTPVESAICEASGLLSLNLGFAPSPGTQLTVIRNTGPAFIQGTFTNAPQGSTLTLTHDGQSFPFVVNYFGGNGRSLVLHWPYTQLAAWGTGPLGNPQTPNSSLKPIAVTTNRAMNGKTITATAIGTDHSLALTSDGTVFAWGNNLYGQLGIGDFTNRALPTPIDSSGTLAGETIVAIAAGSYHSLALTASGRVFAWGYNLGGALGNPNTANHPLPTAIDTSGPIAGKTLTAIAAAANGSLALTSDGRVFAWGNNQYGQLGNASNTPSYTPVAVDTSGPLANETVIAIDAFSATCIAATSTGKVITWGYNSRGQLGNGTTTHANTPVAVNTDGPLKNKTIIGVAAGALHCLALSNDGLVFAWGSNVYGTLGNRSFTDSYTPVTAQTYGFVFEISAGTVHSAALTYEGQPLIWGANESAQIGDNTLAKRSAPTSVAWNGTLLDHWPISLTAGSNSNLAIHDAGPPTIATHPSAILTFPGNSASFTATTTDAFPTTVHWQVSTSGPDGPYTTLENNPSAATPKLTLTQLDASHHGHHYRAVFTTPSGSTPTRPAKLEVHNRSAQLTSPTTNPFTSERVVASGSIQLELLYEPAPGNNITLIQNTGPAFIEGTFDNLPQGAEIPLTHRGVTYRFIANYHGGNGRSLVLHWPCTELASWGWNLRGQLADGTTMDRSTPITPTTVLTGSYLLAISAGESHSLALTADGRIFAWGSNLAGQLGNQSTTSSSTPVEVFSQGALASHHVVAITAGYNTSFAITREGRLFGWGSNYDGQLGLPNRTTITEPADLTGIPELAGQTITSIASGTQHTLALTSSGSVLAWGSNNWRQLGNDATSFGYHPPVATSPSPDTIGETYSAIAASNTFSLALTTTGKVLHWGENTGSAPKQLADNGVLAEKQITAITTSTGHSLALTATGELYAWGWNTSGQLGNGSTTTSDTPVLVDGTGTFAGKSIAAITAGSSHSLILTADGSCFAWGAQTASGTGSSTNLTRPAPPAGALTGRTVTAVATRTAHNLALLAAGPPTVTRDPLSHLAAIGTTVHFSAETTDPFPHTIQWQESANGPDGPFVDITAPPSATTHTLALGPLTPDMHGHAFRAVFTNAAGHSLTDAATLTLTDWTTTLPTPHAAPFSSPAVTASGNFNLTLTSPPVPGTDLTLIENTGPAHIAGSFANLRQGELIRLVHADTTFPMVVNYFGGNGRSLVLQWPWYRAAAWGYNFYGQLGTNSTTNSPLPAAVVANDILATTPLTRLAAGGSHSLALTSTGQLLAWGANSSGQLGDRSTTSRSSPTPVDTSAELAGKSIIALAAGGSHSLALAADGTLYGWGSNNSGQLGDGTKTNRPSPTPVITTALLPGESITSLAAGNGHSLALTSHGRLLAWGSNSQGQLGTGTNTSALTPTDIPTTSLLRKSITAIAAGKAHSLALASDGTLFVWGDNSYRQLGPNFPSGGSSSLPTVAPPTGSLTGKTPIAIATTGNHNLVLASDGTAHAWGANESGQLGNGSTTTSAIPTALDLPASPPTQITAIAAGSDHSLAITTTGTALAWGANASGQLGNGNTTTQTSPTPISTQGAISTQSIRQVHGGGSHSLALFAAASNPVVTTHPRNRTLIAANNAAPQTLTFSARATDVIPLAIQWQIRSENAPDTFTNITDNPSATTGHLVLTVSADAPAPIEVRAQFFHEAGAVSTRPASIQWIRPLAPVTFTTPADCPFTAESPMVSGSLEVNLAFSPTPGTPLTLVRNTGPAFIQGIFTNLPHGATLPLNFDGHTHSYVINYYGGSNGRSLTLEWPTQAVAAWGVNSQGELGDNTLYSRSTPVPSASSLSGQPITRIAAGTAHTLALTAHGRLFAWGSNTSGQLGNHSSNQSSSPVEITTSGDLDGHHIVAIAAGPVSSLALSADGSLFSWGSNLYGQLGFASPSPVATPTLVPNTGPGSGRSFSAIAIGGAHCLALTESGEVFTWGANSLGQLGNGTTISSSAPQPVANLTDRTVTAIAAGESHCLVLTTANELFAWGSNASGQLGSGTFSTFSSLPTPVNQSGTLKGKTIRQIAAGSRFSLALTSNGTASTWGLNSDGQLGTGNTGMTSNPQPVVSSGVLAGIQLSSATTGYSHTIALSSSGTAFAWGNNDSYQLGNASTMDSLTPITVNTSGILNTKFLSTATAGKSHSLAVYGLGTAPTLTSQPAATSTTAPATATFSAAASGYPTPTVRWQVSRSGPSGPFSNINSATNPSAITPTLTLLNTSPNLSGYAYRAIFTNASGSATSSPATLTTLPSLDWFIQSQNITPTDPLATPSNSGIPTLIAYAFNLSPSAPNLSQLPSITLTDGFPEISFSRWASPPDITYTIESSSDLLSWSPDPNFTTSSSPIASQPAMIRITARASLPILPNTHRYFRIRISTNH